MVEALSPRNANGLIAENDIEDVARDAIQVGHATGVTVRNNTGRRIGYPFELVDMAGWAVPVALDTAGNVDKSTYAGNAGSPTPLARFRHRVVGFGGLVGSSGNGTLWQYVSGTQMQDLAWLAIKGFAQLQHVAPHIHAAQQSALMETLAKLLLADQKAACAGLLLGCLVTNQRVQVKRISGTTLVSGFDDRLSNVLELA